MESIVSSLGMCVLEQGQPLSSIPDLWSGNEVGVRLGARLGVNPRIP